MSAKNNPQTDHAAAQHTPGPWYISEPGVYIDGPSGRGLAAIVMAETAEVRLANARLIAASPEMLEALRTIEDTLGCNLQWLNDALPSMLAAHQRGAIERLRAIEAVWKASVVAIAKATGAKP